MLISTKFHSPLTVGRLTLRPRLDECLDEALRSGRPLVLVTAPAGFGKSTLMSAWLRSQATHSSWLSPDNSDNDPGQFLSYPVGALQIIDPSIGANQMNRQRDLAGKVRCTPAVLQPPSPRSVIAMEIFKNRS